MNDTRIDRTLGLLALLVIAGVGSILLVLLTRSPVVECQCLPVAGPEQGGRNDAKPLRAQPIAEPRIDGANLEWLKGLYDYYYPRPNTQGFEEMFIRDYFQDEQNGFFVDIGASHYRERNTTYYLEKHLKWSGIAADALEEYRDGYEKFRPNTRYFAAYVGEKSDDLVDFFVVKSNKRLSSSDKGVRNQHAGDYTAEKIKTITMNDLLKANGVERFDLLSMDIELAEPAALRGFDLQKYEPELVVIEMHEEVRAEIEKYFLDRAYVAIEPYSQLDPLNDYFVPADRLAAFKARRSLAPPERPSPTDAAGSLKQMGPE